MVFYAILRQILNYCFCAISSRELSVCAIFYAISDYECSLFWACFLVDYVLVPNL